MSVSDPHRTTGTTARVTITATALVALLLAPGRLAAAEREHPFLLTSRAEFPALVERATREPWATMVAKARAQVEQGIPKPDDHKGRYAFKAQRFLGALAICYIVDEERRRTYAETYHQAMKDRKLMRESFRNNGGGGWRRTVPPLGVIFTAIIVLDIVHDDLADDERTWIENQINYRLRNLRRKGTWTAARIGTLGTWAIYRGERTEPDDDYHQRIIRQITPDGVSRVSPNYAFARLVGGNGRPQKAAYADVLEYTGIDRRYYGDPRIARFYRWACGSSVTPAKQFYMFGDVAPYWGPPNAGLLYRVGKFDSQAATYAAWLLEDRTPPGHILPFLLMDAPLPEPEVPGSALFPTGGAFFREPADDPDSLGAMLYNLAPGPGDSHTHQEANGISLSAYGARLLVNGGWLGDTTDPAPANNTLTVGGREHRRYHGAGLQEGLIGPGIDYAAGDAGPALGKRHHVRSLVLVHGRSDAPGYAVIIDEVAAEPDDRVHTYFHPATERDVAVVAEGLHLAATIDHHVPVSGVHLDLFLAPEPATVALSEQPSGSLERAPKSGHHRRIEVIHPTDDAGGLRTVTLLHPRREGQERPTVARLDLPGAATGLRLVHPSGVADLLLASMPDADLAHDGVDLRGAAALVRRTGDAVPLMLARHATRLRIGPHGFTSEAPVSLALAGDLGRVRSDGTTLTLFHPAIDAVDLNGAPAPIADRGEGWAAIEVPEGSHDLRLHVGE